MKKLYRPFFLFILIILINSAFSYSTQIALANKQVNDEQKRKGIIVLNEQEQLESLNTYLFSSESTDSDILMTLKDEQIITILKEDEPFSYVEITDDSDEILTGYILNEFIEFEENKQDELIDLDEDDKENKNEQAKNDDKVTEDEATDEEENENEQGIESRLKTLKSKTVLKGIALEENTNIYAEQSKDSSVLKSYKQGTILQYFEYDDHWYEARVKIDGEWKIGYLNKSDVENITEELISLEGIALKQPTNVYSKPSQEEKVLRSYEAGSILKYRTFTDDWYLARVKYKGNWETGYIHKTDVENVESEQTPLKGIALKDNTTVYEKASKNTKALKKYGEGTILKYQTFSSQWYIARVKYKGAWKTGYIHKDDVEDTFLEQETLSGISLKQPTHVYTKATRKAPTHKSYNEGAVLKFKTFSNHWYEAIVYVNGKRNVGYIHKDDIEQTLEYPEEMEAWTKKSPTNIYSLTSRNAKVIKTLNKNKRINIKALTKDWYEIKVDGKTGYVHKDDISSTNITYTEYNLTLEEAKNIQLKNSPQTDKKQAWVSKHYISNSKVTADKLNVRLGPGTNYRSVDTIDKGTQVKIIDEYNGWYVIEFDHNSQWTHASPKDVMANLNPENFLNDEKQQFQFLDLSRPSGASVSVLDNFLKDKGILSNQGKAFIDAAKKQGINDIYLISHALLETGNGQSKLANGLDVGLDRNGEPQLVNDKNKNELTNIKTVYNMFGIRAFDSCPEACGAAYAYNEGWDTPYKSIIGGAAFISADYIQGKNNEGTVLNTLYKMRWNPEFASINKQTGKQYATDVEWAVKQVNNMYNLYEAIGDYELILDIPVYKR